MSKTYLVFVGSQRILTIDRPLGQRELHKLSEIYKAVFPPVVNETKEYVLYIFDPKEQQ